MKKIALLSFAIGISLSCYKIIDILQEIKTDIRKLRIAKVGNF